MSLVFCKNKDQSQRAGRATGMKPYRWSNYLTNPLMIPRNAQVAYVSSTFNLNPNGSIQDDAFMYSIIGLPELNCPIPIIPPDSSVDNWASEVNFLATLCNQYGTDATYVDVNYKDAIYENITQNQYIQGNGSQGETQSAWNIFYRQDDKVDIRVTPRYINSDEFNQYYNCAGRNPSMTTLAPLTVGEGINAGTLGDKDFTHYTDTEYFQVPSPNGQVTFTADKSSEYELGEEPVNNSYNTTAGFYNVPFTYDSINNENYDWGYTGAGSISLPPFDSGSFGACISYTGVKQYIGAENVTANGGGHQGIGAFGSGGYCIYTFGNVDKALADNHYDTAYAGAGNEGFCGIPEQFFGLQSIPLIQSYGDDYTTAMTEYMKVVDINNSSHSTIPRGATARYLIGVRMYEADGTLFAQTQVLDPSSTLENSKYIDVGRPLDIKKLSNGITTAVSPDYTFNADANYSLNTAFTTPKVPAGLMFRFRWSSPYCIAVEYMLSAEGKEDSYNVIADTPYVPALVPTVGDPVVDPSSETVELDETTDGTTRVLTNNTTFTDSGGSGGNYNPNEEYTITFDAKAGYTTKITFNSFGFEHSTFAMYDRLGMQVSNDGVNFTNFSGIPWLNKSATSTPPYSTSFAGSTQSNTSSYGTDGYILPQNLTIAQSYDNTLTLPFTFQTSFRYLRFTFLSDNSSQEQGWNITLQPNTPYLSGATFTNANPEEEWCLLYDMKQDFTLENAYYIPSYFGDLGLVSYQIADSTSHHTRGYFDLRRANRYTERLARNETSAQLYNRLDKYSQFFTNAGGFRATSILTKNDAGFTTPKLINVIPEEFDATDGRPMKDIKIMANTMRVQSDTDFLQTVLGQPMFRVQEPFGLEMGYILGWIKITDQASLVSINNDIEGGGAYFDYGFDGLGTIQLNDKAFSNHICIQNLPIQSANGVKSTQTKCIYVINSLCVNSIQNSTIYRLFCDTAPQLIWIDLNNYAPMTLNQLDILITDDENKEQRLLTGNTDITLIFREKPTQDSVYLPQNIQPTNAINTFNQPM